MTIKKINLNLIEEFLKEIVEDSIQIKTFKEEIDHINQAIGNNENIFKSGKISNEVYKDIKKNLENEKKLLNIKITLKKNNVLDTSKELSEIINDNKI